VAFDHARHQRHAAAVNDVGARRFDAFAAFGDCIDAIADDADLAWEETAPSAVENSCS
jgi:hypothetical protein